jgi:hypothetical protein
VADPDLIGVGILKSRMSHAEARSKRRNIGVRIREQSSSSEFIVFLRASA